MGILKKIRYIVGRGRAISRDKVFLTTQEKSKKELLKTPFRTKIINQLLQLNNAENYLEIGVRNPDTNFNRIKCKTKYSVDPGLEHITNPVDFKFTSDVFFKYLKDNKLEAFDNTVKFDAIFIDGLHTSIQAERDIRNSLEYLSDYGFIIIHDCNPPTEYHQREDYSFKNSPANLLWNGTTWKAFYKFRHRVDLFSICFDSDWGVGVISKKRYPMFNNIQADMANPFYEYTELSNNRENHLNLVNFHDWKSKQV